MTTIKSFTDLSQSKTLSKILPLESADMYYFDDNGGDPNFKVRNGITYYYDSEDCLSCWSLAALFDVLSKSSYFINETGIVELSSIKAIKWCVSILNCGKIENCYADNPVDACYEMIIKLHELNLL